MDVDLSQGKPEEQGEKETARARESPKAKEKTKHNGKGKSAGKDKSSQETFRGTCRDCGKTGHTWSACWAKGGGAAKQANSVGETGKTGDVNDGQTITMGHEEWRCSGTSVSCKKRTRISSCQSRRVRLRNSQFQCCRTTCDTAELG